MALGDLSFKLWNDSAQTDAFTGTLSVTHQTDLSDNDQDFVLYFGSNDSDAQLEATSNPGSDQITITPTDGLDEWQATTAYSLGDIIEPVGGNGYRYVVTTAGTSDSSEPTWPTGAIGSTVTDGTVVWSLQGARHALTEVKLATSSAGLDSATGGAALDIGATLSGGTGNQVEIHIRITNAVTTAYDNSADPGILLNINEVEETVPA